MGAGYAGRAWGRRLEDAFLVALLVLLHLGGAAALGFLGVYMGGAGEGTAERDAIDQVQIALALASAAALLVGLGAAALRRWGAWALITVAAGAMAALIFILGSSASG